MDSECRFCGTFQLDASEDPGEHGPAWASEDDPDRRKRPMRSYDVFEVQSPTASFGIGLGLLREASLLRVRGSGRAGRTRQASQPRAIGEAPSLLTHRPHWVL